MVEHQRAQHEVIWSAAALKTLRKLDQATQQRILKAAQLLGSNPHPPTAKRLSGVEAKAGTVVGARAQSAANIFRIRVGDWRVLYLVSSGELTVLVIKVGHRSKVYRNL